MGKLILVIAIFVTIVVAEVKLGDISTEERADNYQYKYNNDSVGCVQQAIKISDTHYIIYGVYKSKPFIGVQPYNIIIRRKFTEDNITHMNVFATLKSYDDIYRIVKKFDKTSCKIIGCSGQIHGESSIDIDTTHKCIEWCIDYAHEKYSIPITSFVYLDVIK